MEPWGRPPDGANTFSFPIQNMRVILNKKIEIDISATLQALQSNPDLVTKINELFVGKAVAEELEKYDRLRAAVAEIYFAAVWSPDRVCDAQKLWTELRDAAGFLPGSSTEHLGKNNATATNAEGES